MKQMKFLIVFIATTLWVSETQAESLDCQGQDVTLHSSEILFFQTWGFPLPSSISCSLKLSFPEATRVRKLQMDGHEVVEIFQRKSFRRESFSRWDISTKFDC